MEHITNSDTSQLGGALISKRVAAQLMEAVRSGRYSRADRLPPELELAEEFSVSRTVIRDALSDLEREGFIERVRGIGTVINHSVARLKFRLDQKFEYNDMIRAAGFEPQTDSVQLHRQQADAAIAGALGLEVGCELLCIGKRVLAGAEPAIYSLDYLPAALLGLKPKNMDFSRPIFDLLERKLHIQITSAIAHTRAVCGPPAVRQALQLGADDALLLLEEVGYDRLCHPVMYSRSYYTDFFDFSLLRKKI